MMPSQFPLTGWKTDILFKICTYVTRLFSWIRKLEKLAKFAVKMLSMPRPAISASQQFSVWTWVVVTNRELFCAEIASSFYYPTDERWRNNAFFGHSLLVIFVFTCKSRKNRFNGFYNSFQIKEPRVDDLYTGLPPPPLHNLDYILTMYIRRQIKMIWPDWLSVAFCVLRTY